MPETPPLESVARKSTAHSGAAKVSDTPGIPPQLALLPSPIQNSIERFVVASMNGVSFSSCPPMEASANSAPMVVFSPPQCDTG